MQDGVTPENNVTDNAADAWNDSITVSKDSSSDNSSQALIIVDPAVMTSPVQTNLPEHLAISVDIHNHGLHFGIPSQGNQLLSLLLAAPIPRQQLNASIY